MDASSLHESRRVHTLFTFHQMTRGTFRRDQSRNRPTGELPLNIRVGSLGSIALPSFNCVFRLDELIIWFLLEQLTYTATINAGPTRSSRLNYIFFSTIAQAFNYVSPILSGIKDDWNWNTHEVLTDDMEIYVFVNNALIECFPRLVPTFDITLFKHDERIRMGWTPQQQNEYVNQLKEKTKFSSWFSNWSTWYNSRQNDNSVQSAIPPQNSDLPNGVTSIDPEKSQNYNDTTTFPKKFQWTPIVVNGKKQKWLTWNWLNVRSTCLTNTDDNTLMTKSYSDFPTNRLSDIESLVSTVTQIKDREKIIAEFWAGGPYTSSPPGILMYLWLHFIKSTNIMEKVGIKKIILSGLELATNLFEVGRLVWGVKKYYTQSRPIQDIRNMYSMSTIKAYNGSNIPGSLWLPFQANNFITPPFPDFPSGHSAFSRVFSIIMTNWYGSQIPAQSSQMCRLSQIVSPLFKTDPISGVGNYEIASGSSEIQPGIVPSMSIQLSWNTWNEMAESAGLSRQYGGIHAMSAHTGSITLADSLVPVVNSYWNFRN